jgi:CRP-like cAMP-binding protein
MPFSPWKEKLLKNLLLITSRKNLHLSGRSFHTSPKSCRGRLLSYLNAVSLQKGSSEFDIPFDRQQLADYLNLERTNMSKELSRMQKEGILECRKSHFKLLEIE